MVRPRDINIKETQQQLAVLIKNEHLQSSCQSCLDMMTITNQGKLTGFHEI